MEKPQFSVPRGFYAKEIQVSIACPTPDATIYYTIDGSTPGALAGTRSGTNGAVYKGPIRVSQTTCLRATATKTGWYSSPTETHTYLFVNDVITQSPYGVKPGPAWPAATVSGQVIDYGMDPDVVNDPRYKNLMDDALLAIPSISLVTNLANLFDPATGIYAHASMRGQAWERPVSVELIYPDGTRGIPDRRRPADSRRLQPQRPPIPSTPFACSSGRTTARPSSSTRSSGPKASTSSKASICGPARTTPGACEGGSRDTFVREVFSRDTQRDMGEPYTRSRYYHLYIDGQYWGLYQTEERPESSYAASYFGGDKDDYDVIKSKAGDGGHDVEATDGTLDNWRLLWNASVSGFGNDATYYRVQGLEPRRHAQSRLSQAARRGQPHRLHALHVLRGRPGRPRQSRGGRPQQLLWHLQSRESRWVQVLPSRCRALAVQCPGEPALYGGRGGRGQQLQPVQSDVDAHAPDGPSRVPACGSPTACTSTSSTMGP